MTYIGKGIFTLPDVARYTGTPTPTLRRWFGGARPLLANEIDKHGNHTAVSFHNLVEVLVTKALREFGVSTLQVRRAVELLRVELGTPVPLSRREIRTDGKSLFVHIADKTGDEELYELFTRQKHMPKIVMDHLQTVAYDSLTSEAARWDIAPGVVIDPAICFGVPTIGGTRVKAETLYYAWKAEKKDAFRVADAYEVTVGSVHAAVHFGQHYLNAA